MGQESFIFIIIILTAGHIATKATSSNPDVPLESYRHSEIAAIGDKRSA